jgi:hypothetical protein
VEKMRANRKSDEQLDVILRETNLWIVNGDGEVLAFAPSLGVAIDRATAFVRSGAVVTNLARLPRNDIVVPFDQVLRLSKIVAGREVPVLQLAK